MSQPPTVMFVVALGVTADGALGVRRGTLGFYIDPKWRFPRDLRIIFPLWLPTLLLLALNGFVCRKTRPIHADGAFPIEPAPTAAKAQ